jgi:hypothetical protein
MKNLKNTYLRLSPFYFLGWGSICAREDKSLPLANEEYADNKFVDAEANYRVSNSKLNRTCILQLRKRYLQAEPSF